MDYYMACSLQFDLLARFLGGSSRWTITCKAALELALEHSFCSCQYRFQSLLRLAETRSEPLVKTCNLSRLLFRLPVSVFWHARITSVIKHIDQVLGLTDQCDALVYQVELVGRLECLFCASRSFAVWERKSLHDSDKHYFCCSKCLIQAYHQIKHTATTSQHQANVLQRVLAHRNGPNMEFRCGETIYDGTKWVVHTNELFFPDIHGISLRKVERPRCAHCDGTWRGWYCQWCRNYIGAGS